MKHRSSYLLSVAERLLDCPKLMTNGPCGGVALDGTCEVDKRICVWAETIAASPGAENHPAPPGDWSAPEPFSDLFGEPMHPRTVADTLDRDRRPLSGTRSPWAPVAAGVHDGSVLLWFSAPRAGLQSSVHIDL